MRSEAPYAQVARLLRDIVLREMRDLCEVRDHREDE
jgi:hypothetical protein